MVKSIFSDGDKLAKLQLKAPNGVFTQGLRGNISRHLQLFGTWIVHSGPKIELEDKEAVPFHTASKFLSE